MSGLHQLATYSGTLWLGLWLFSCSLASAEESQELRVLTYNIHGAVGTDRVFDLERIAKVIRSTDPHIVALQEVDKETHRSKGTDSAKKLGELTGMESRFAFAISARGGEYGNALLTSLEIKETDTISIPEEIPVEKRCLLSATLIFNDSPIQILATHLCHRESQNRERAAREIVQHQASDQVTSFVLGDLNALPESDTLKTLMKAGWQKPGSQENPTVPAALPTRQIDYILCRPATKGSLMVKEVRVIDEPVASDHRPLLVVFEWNP